MRDLLSRVPRGGDDVVTFGEALVVLIAEAGVPLPAAHRFTRTVAGSEVNVAVGMARAGHKVSFWSRVGADAFGDVVLRTLLAEGIDSRGVLVDPEAPTGLLVRDAHSERPVEVAYYRGGSAASHQSVGDVDAQTVATARLLYATGIVPLLSESCAELSMSVLQQAKAAGTLVAFDPNLRLKLLGNRSPELLMPYAKYADIILTGIEEGEAITRTRGQEALADAFLGNGASLVVVKRGERGTWATDGRVAWEAAPPAARVLDPFGAGDAFNSGFLSRVLDGWDIAPALEGGALFGRLAVQAVGDVEGLPTRRQLSMLNAVPESR